MATTLSELVDEFEKCHRDKSNIGFFCGAGISFHSGLPLANELVKALLSALELSDEEMRDILGANLPFERFLETIKTEVEIDDVLDIYSRGEPNVNHLFIARLIRRGIIKTVLTTNFDELIEIALRREGFEEGRNFDVFRMESDFGKIGWSDPKPRIIKIHGCISDKESIAATLSAVSNRTNCHNKNTVIKQFFSDHINKTIVVLGYSCSDLFDLTPQISLINGEASDIVFVNHNRSRDPSIEHISEGNAKVPFKAFKGMWVNIDTDVFIEALWNKLIELPYTKETSSFDWNGNVYDWFEKIQTSDTIGVKHHVAARLFYSAGQFQHCVVQCEKGIAVAQKLGNNIAFFSELGNLGMAFNALGRYPEAKRCLEESVLACKEIGNVQAEIAQRQALGHVYRNLREFQEAERSYLHAVELSEKLGDSFQLCTSLGNLATVYNQFGKPNSAIACLKRGLELASRIGNAQSEASMLCSLGICYCQLGQTEMAIQCINDSLRTNSLIGDRQGECITRLNLSNVYLTIDDFDKCIENAQLALSIAKQIESKQSEGNAYYNLGVACLRKRNFTTAAPWLKAAVQAFTDLYGHGHSHTIAARAELQRAETH